MSDVELFLTDEFVSFAKKISEVLDKKKAKEAEMKQLYSQFKDDLKELEAEAAVLYQEWENFKAGRSSGEVSE
ncbi:MAG: hypothetical protein DWQ19_10865 [Crenarchaeota archaeon]|nr:MAG: hypothetical protein DWQ19_10865 [Thermoproteota archaeon]